jgi:hypothetical protein
MRRGQGYGSYPFHLSGNDRKKGTVNGPCPRTLNRGDRYLCTIEISIRNAGFFCGHFVVIVANLWVVSVQRGSKRQKAKQQKSKGLLGPLTTA